MKRILLALALILAGSAVHAATNVTIAVTGPTGGDLAICSDAAGTSCSAFTVTSDASGKITLFAKPGCVTGPYTVTFSVPPAAALASDTATINVVAGPLVRLSVTTGKTQSVPIKGGTTSIAVAGADVCNNPLPLP